MASPYIVGITGGSASGKTLLLSELRRLFRDDELCLLSQDNYYKPLKEQVLDENGVENFDIPESINLNAFVEDVVRLKGGEKVTREEYTFNNSNAAPNELTFKPAPIIVVEGIFVFYLRELVDLLDLKIFVDAKDHLMVKRRILRDAKERGYDIEDVLYRFEYHVMPSYEKYIKPFKHDADIIIPNNGDSLKNGLGVLAGYLKGKIA